MSCTCSGILCVLCRALRDRAPLQRVLTSAVRFMHRPPHDAAASHRVSGLQAAEGKAPVIDPAAAKKAAEEAEERRLAEIRALGTRRCC